MAASIPVHIYTSMTDVARFWDWIKYRHSAYAKRRALLRDALHPFISRSVASEPRRAELIVNLAGNHGRIPDLGMKDRATEQSAPFIFELPHAGEADHACRD